MVLYQACLQNTVEQTAYAIPVYLVSGILLQEYRYIIPTSSITIFVIGRLLFFQRFEGWYQLPTYHGIFVHILTNECITTIRYCRCGENGISIVVWEWRCRIVIWVNVLFFMGRHAATAVSIQFEAN